MDFDLKKPTGLAEQIDRMIHSFRLQNYGNYPTRILASYNTTMALLDETKTSLSCKVDFKPPYKFCGIKIVRSVDVDDNTIELF